MGTNVAASGFTFDKVSVGGTWFWTVRASNVQSSSQTYQVTDITSPFGRLGAVDVPIPGDVVIEMASSITQLQQQLAPAVALVGSTPTSYSVTVTEGESRVQVAIVPFQNIGAFGSFLTVNATPDAQWISANPSSVPGLNKNDQGRTTIFVDPSILLASGSPYVGHVNIQDNRVPSTLIPITVNVTVLPRPIVAVSPAAVSLSYTITTGAQSGPQAFAVSNSGPVGSSMNFAAAKVLNNSPWLSFSPASGGPLNAGDSASVTCSLVVSGIPAAPGTYTETILVSSPTAGNTPVAVLITLTVNP